MKLMSPRAQADPDGRMSLMEHIRELRRRIIRAGLGIAVGAGIAWYFYGPIWNFLQRPYCKVPQAHRLGGGECLLTTTGLLDPFFNQMKISFTVGLVISSPIWLYQLWAFIAPGLYNRERRWTYVFIAGAVPLFTAGAALSYVMLDKGLSVLLGFTPDHVVPMITITSYLGYLNAMLLIFGLSFELPLVVVILNLAGVLTHERIKKWRRGLIFGIFVFTAVATPSTDPFTMLALAIPMVILFEAAELFAWIHDKRKDRSNPYAGLADDDISPLDLDDGHLDTSDETSEVETR